MMAMMELALREKYGPVTLADIAHYQGTSLSYLEQLFAHLRKQGLVKGVRGPGGGYHLARHAQQITVAEIISAVDDKPDAGQCQEEESIQQGERNLPQGLWGDLSKRIHDFLNEITLAQFLDRPEVQDMMQQYASALEDAQRKRSAA